MAALAGDGPVNWEAGSNSCADGPASREGLHSDRAGHGAAVGADASGCGDRGGGHVEPGGGGGPAFCRSCTNRAWARLFGRYVRFCAVGMTGMALDMSLLHVLASPSCLGWNLSLSKALAAEAALLNNFVWNEVWTFRDLAERGDRRASGTAVRAGAEGGAAAWRVWRGRLRRLIRFNVICLAGIGLSVVLLNLQVHGLGWNVYLSNFNAIVLVSVWNFWMNLRFGWGGGTGTLRPMDPLRVAVHTEKREEDPPVQHEA